jgi:hypothetical protein
MQVEELYTWDPAEDGPMWSWIGGSVFSFSVEAAARVRQDYARHMLDLQKRYCLSGDAIHAIMAMSWATLHHAMIPPWAEAVVGRLAWATLIAPTVIQGRRRRQTHWIRYAAVRDHLRWQRDAGKRRNVSQACRDASRALRGRPGRGEPKRIEASFLLVSKAVRRGEVSRYLLEPLDRRYRRDLFNSEVPRVHPLVRGVPRVRG